MKYLTLGHIVGINIEDEGLKYCLFALGVPGFQ